MQNNGSEFAGPRAAELDYGLESEFITNLDHEQKLRVFDLTARASRELHRWAARYPLIRRVRVWPVTLTVAAAVPFASADVVINMARMSLWIFTIDDLFDEEIVPSSQLERRVARYNEILCGSRADSRRERDSLVLALQDIRDDLSAYPLYPALRDGWAHAASSTLNAMLREHDWRVKYRTGDGITALPDYQSYLNYAIYSIGGPPVIWTSLIAMGDESTLQHREHLIQLERVASLCLRLANDLRSRAKEVAEGNVNSIVILQQEAIARGYDEDTALTIACDTVRQEIQAGLARCDELQRHGQTATGNPERAMADMARFVCDFYVKHDYHTFTAGRA